MIEDRYLELINRALDGDLDEREMAQLNEYLARTPEARQIHQELDRVSRMLSRAERCAPSPQLKQRVLAAIATAHPVPRPRATLVSRVRSVLTTRLAIRYGTVFATGLVCGIVLLALNTGLMKPAGVIAPQLFSGAMLPGDSVVGFRTLDTVAIEIGGATGYALARADHGLILIEVELHSSQPLDLRLAFNPADFACLGLVQRRGPVSSLTAHESGLLLTQVSGDRYRFIFSNPSQHRTAITLEVQAEGQPGYQVQLRTGRSGN